MSLRKFCDKTVVTIAPEESVATACHRLREKNIGCLVVEEKGKLRGILTDRDVALKVAGEGRDAKKTKVAEVMTSDPIRIRVDSELYQLTALMRSHHVRRVPIVDGEDQTLGIVTMDDLIALFGEEMSDMAETVSAAVVLGTA